MSNLTIQDNKCWVCEARFSKDVVQTAHHTLPKHLQPKNNVIIPVCEDCHGKINKRDDRGLFLLAVKIDKTMKSVKQMTGSLTNRVHNLVSQNRSNK